MGLNFYYYDGLQPKMSMSVYIVRHCWPDNENPRLEGEGGEAGKDKGSRFLFSHAPSLLLLPCHVR